MNYFNKLLFLPLLFPFISMAQNNYQPGVVVNLKGDTLHGFINYSEWENNPKKISFKGDPNGAPIKFAANEIKYFNVSVGYLAEYESYEGPISMDNTEINHLMIGRDTSYRLDTVFLKVLQKGKNLTIFAYSDSYKVRFFMRENPGDLPKELVYRLYYKNSDENGLDRSAYENTYKSQLYNIAVKLNVMNDALKNYIEKAEYKEEDILAIAGKINQLSPTDPLTTNPSKPRPFNKAIAIVGGIAVIIFTIVEFASIHKAPN
jgi:hypothetical protein